MRKKKLYIAEIPAVSHEFARELARRFPAKEIKPGVTQDDLLYNAGQRSVIEFVLKSASGTVISGDPTDLKPEPNTRSLLNKLLGILR
jgi:hypothetical protein